MIYSIPSISFQKFHLIFHLMGKEVVLDILTVVTSLGNYFESLGSYFDMQKRLMPKH